MIDLGRITVVFKTDYNSTVNYEKLDAVLYQGSTYVSLLNGNIGVTPGSDPSKWQLMAKAGTNANSFNYKGKVDTYAGLPTSGNQQNDAYYNKADQKFYIYNGTSFPVNGDGLYIGISNVIATNFDPLDTVQSQSGKTISEYYSTVKVLDGISTEITNRILNGVINDSGQFVTINGYTTTGLVNVSDSIKVKVVDLNPPTQDYSVKFYDVNNVMIKNHRQTGTYELEKPVNAVWFMMNIVTGSTTLKAFTVKAGSGTEDLGTSSKVDIDTALVKYKPVNSVAVSKYVDTKMSSIVGNIKFYETNISNVRLNIDDFTGTDDEKIEKAVALLENVGGGEIYLPGRQINITRSILVPSNFRFLLDGENCKIQMSNNIHDNIFRSKGLKINSSAPNGIQLGADVTQNFEIIGIGVGMPSIRHSLQPLHVSDKFGWRGISMLFTNCRTYKIENIKVVESHMWSISNEYSEYGTFNNIEFSNTLYANADGLNFRNGCRHHRAKKLKGLTNDNAVAVTILDGTWPVSVGPNAGYSWQALGYSFSNFNGADDIVVEDVQVRSRFGSGLIIGTSYPVSNITFKDFVSTVATPTGEDWDNVAVCGNQFRTYVYGSSYIDGIVKNINIINSSTSVHEYSLAVYGGRIDNLFVSGIINTKPSQLGVIKNDTTSVVTVQSTLPTSVDTKVSSNLSNQVFNNTLYYKSGNNISKIIPDPVWPAVGLVVDSNGLTLQNKGVILDLQTNLNKRFIQFNIQLRSDSLFYVGTKNTEVSVGENMASINCSTGKIKIHDLFGSGTIEKDIPFSIVNGREYIVRYYKLDGIVKLELVDLLSSESVNVQIFQLGQFDKYKFGLDNASTITIKSIGVYSIYKERPYIGFYGDSITEGNVVGTSTKTPYYRDRFANLIGEKLGKPYFVSARSGGGILGVLARMKNELPVLLPKYIFVTVGTDGNNTTSNLNQFIDYCEGLGVAVILNLIPLYDGGTAGANVIIQNIVNARGLMSVQTNRATSVNGDGITKDNSKFANENGIFLHPNESGHLAIYKRALIDIKSLFAESASELTTSQIDNSASIESKVTTMSTVLKSFLVPPVDEVKSEYKWTDSTQSIYGISPISGLLQKNNTILNYSESGTEFRNWLNVPVSEFDYIDLDYVRLGGSSSGNVISMLGKKSDGTIEVIIAPNSDPATRLLENIKVSVSSYKYISFTLINFTSNNAGLNTYFKFIKKGGLLSTDSVLSTIKSNKPSNQGINFINVLDYNVIVGGSVSDSIRLQNTSIINSLIELLISKGGGTLFFPTGEYCVTEIIIPDIKYWYNIEILGEFIPAQRFGTITAPNLYDPDVTKPNGTVIKSNVVGRGVIFCNIGISYSDFNMGMLTVRNLTIRTYENPQICGIDAYNIFQLYVDNVVIDTGVYNVHSIEPTYDKTGIVTPKNSNCALTYLRNACISGYMHGIKVYEHTNGDSLQVQSCKYAMSFYFASHASYFTRCCYQRNTIQINVVEKHLFEIAQLNMEYAGQGQTTPTNVWQSTQYELNDPNNKGVGRITYANVKGGLDSVTTWRMNGGTGIIVKHIGNDTRVTTNITSP